MKRIGYWGEDGVTEPQDYVDEERSHLRRLCINHLKVGRYAEGWLGYAGCRFGCGAQLGTLCLTDGTYQWPEKYEHYLEHHDVMPPEDFIRYVAQLSDPLNGEHKKLLRIGFWASQGLPPIGGEERKDRDTHWPWPADAQGEMDTKDAMIIGSYLARGDDIDLHYDGTFEPCLLGGDDGCPGEEWMPGHNAGKFKTDGTFVWPADFAHYVTIHQVAVPPIFRSHVLDLHYSHPGS